MSAVVGWLGDGSVPAAVHRPDTEDAPATGVGVVLSAPFGQEQVLSYRTQRLLADTLAAAGVTVVRHEHVGFGDSVADATPDTLLDGARSAARALRSLGVSRIVYVGLGSAALIASAAAADDAAAAGLALWDAPRSGRAWLRTARTLYSFSLGSEAEQTTAEAITIVGADFSPAFATRLGSLDYDPSLVDRFPVLVAPRSETPASLPPALSGVRDRVTIRPVDGHRDLLDGSSIGALIPGSSVASVADWIIETFVGDASSTSEPSRAAVAPGDLVRDSTRFTAGLVELEERALRIGPDELFTVETAAVGAPVDAPTVILHNGSVENRTGVSRHQVILARRLAVLGMRVLRVDRRGEGETGVVRADEPNLLFAAEWLDDSRVLLDHVALPAPSVGVVGMCVGAWIGVTTAADRIGFVAAISPNDYRIVPAEWNEVADLEREAQRAPVEAASGRSARLRALVVRGLRKLPYRILLALAARGRGQLVETSLRPALRTGVDISFLIGPHDTAIFEERRGRAAQRRLARLGGGFTITNLENGDHSLFSPVIRGTSIDASVRIAERAFDGLLGTPPLVGDDVQAGSPRQASMPE